MNLHALFMLADEHPETIRESAVAQGLDPVVVMGVVKLLLANDGNLASLSALQQRCFAEVIGPLIDA